MEHHKHIRLYHPEQSDVAKNSTNLGHRIQFHDISIMAKKSGSMDCITRDTIQNDLHPNSIYKDESFSLSMSWKPLIQTLKERKKALSQEK
jgi:hypothetical protein